MSLLVRSASRLALVSLLGLAASFAAGPRSVRAQSSGAAGPVLETEVGGTIQAVGAEGERTYVALGRRVLAYEAGSGLGAAPVDQLGPLDRRIGAIEPAGRWLLLLTGRPGRRGELVVVARDEGRPMRVVGRLELLRAPLDLAWDGQSAWLARGASGLARVDLSDPGALEIVDEWQPVAAGGGRREVRAVTGRPGAVALLDAPPATEFGPQAPDRLVTLATMGPAPRVLGKVAWPAPLERWALAPDRAILVGGSELHVIRWRATSAPYTDVTLQLQERPLDMAIVADVLALAFPERSEGGQSYVRLEARDLRRGARFLGAVPLWRSAETWRSMAVTKDAVMAADADGWSRVALRPRPKVLGAPKVPTRRYVRAVAAADGALAITADGGLEHVGAGGRLTRLSAPDLRVRDVAVTADQTLALVEGRGVVELRPARDGAWRPGPTLLGAPGDPWEAIHATADTVAAVAHDRILVGRMLGGAPVAQARVVAEPMGSGILLDEDRLWWLDYGLLGLEGRGLWRGSGPEALGSLPLMEPGADPPSHFAGAGRHVLVADATDLVYGIDLRHEAAPELRWRLDMYGDVLAMAVHGDTGWVAWLGEDPGLSQLDLDGAGNQPASLDFRGGWVRNLDAEGDRLWAVMETGALARYRAHRAEPPPPGTATPWAPEHVIWLPWMELEP